MTVKTRRKPKLVRGVGRNDAEGPVHRTVNGKQEACPLYLKWKNLMARQTPEFQLKRPSYAGCKVDKRFWKLSNFKAWAETQTYREPDWETDKDVLADEMPGKLYSPETCCFLPKAINNLFLNRSDGVVWHKAANKWRARLRVDGKNRHIGLFADRAEAVKYYRAAREFYVADVLERYPQLPAHIRRRIQEHASS